MALEAWVILHATGVSISATGALAVETFSRVASFASSFIPANLGALEASSLAAAAAVGASGGGAALALARRLRGLFWAGLGLAIYPRGVRPSQPAAPGTPQVPATRSGGTLLYFPEGAGQETEGADGGRGRARCLGGSRELPTPQLPTPKESRSKQPRGSPANGLFGRLSPSCSNGSFWELGFGSWE